MGFDVAAMIRQADEYLRRAIKSKAVRAAEKRRQERQSREAEARIKRAALLGGASGAAILGVGTLVAPVAAPVLAAAAGGGALLLAVGSLFRPARRSGAGKGDFSKAELADLPGDAEDWLLDRRESLPLDCSPQLDRIFQRLGDLQPGLAALPPHSTRAWEARRLLGDHLPRLVLAFEAIPPTAREEEPQVGARLRAGLETVADALDQLCGEVCRNPLMTFETQERFLETRYRGEDRRLMPGEGRNQNLPSKRAE